MDYRFIDFNKYKSPSDVDGYELFIGPKGEYYKVKTRYESDRDCTHYLWAEGYFLKYGLDYLMEEDYIKEKCQSRIDVLINFLGFVRYTHMYNDSIPFITKPNPSYFGVSISDDQMKSLLNIIEYNNDYIEKDYNPTDYVFYKMIRGKKRM